MIVETDRLTLRPFTQADLPAYARLHARPEIARFLPGELDRLNRVDEIVARNLDVFDSGWADRGYAPWAVVLRDNGALIGQCGLNWLDEMEETELLYALHPDHWRKGIAAEACRAALDFAFGACALNRVIALAMPGNTASLAVMAKLGMRPQEPLIYKGLTVACTRIDAVDWR